MSPKLGAGAVSLFVAAAVACGSRRPLAPAPSPLAAAPIKVANAAPDGRAEPPTTSAVATCSQQTEEFVRCTGHPSSLEADSSYVFWSEEDVRGGAIRRRRFDGDDVETLIPTEPGVRWFAVDKGDIYYFASQDLRMRVGATGQVRVLTPHVGSWVSRLALDDAFVYWSTRSAAVVRVARGGGAIDEISNDQGIVDLDVGENTIWWLGKGQRFVPRGLMRKSASESAKLVWHGDGRKVRVCGKNVFWNDTDAGTLLRINAAGGPTEIIANVDPVEDIFCTTRWVYWTEPTRRVVRRAGVAGGQAEDVVRHRTFNITGDDCHIYWLEDFSDHASVMRATVE